MQLRFGEFFGVRSKSYQAVYNLVDTLWISLFSWTKIWLHYFCGHAAVFFTIFWNYLLAVQWMSLFLWNSKDFPRTSTTTTNKLFLRQRQGSLAVKKESLNIFLLHLMYFKIKMAISIHIILHVFFRLINLD